jgi:iron-sulfur cluster assembly protein
VDLFLYDLYHGVTRMIIIQSPVKITAKAVSEIRNILDRKKIPSSYGLRVGVKDGGQETASHILGFDIKNENDNEYTVEGIPVYIRKSDILHLAGMTIDYFESPQVTGFTFNK